MHNIKTYFKEIKQVLEHTSLAEISTAVDLLIQSQTERRRIFVMGNGGSAAMASHFACDLGKGAVIEEKPRFKVYSLADNISMLTAYGNDVGYEVVFSEPLQALAEPGDLAVLISSSGNSQNIINAADTAKDLQLKTLAVTGFEGGKLRDKVDVCVIVPTDHEHPDCMQHAEDAQGIVLHAIFVAIRQRLNNS
jgi:D-sedoheptulose 7-phosphate isomerase